MRKLICMIFRCNLVMPKGQKGVSGPLVCKRCGKLYR